MKRILICLIVFAAGGVRAADQGVLLQMEQEVTQIVERASPAVVAVRVQRDWAENNARSNAAPTPGRKGGQQSRAAQNAFRAEGNGTGFFVSADGWIVTSLDVVENADRVTVILADHRRLSARVAGRDRNSGLALLRVEGAGFPTVPLGDSDAVKAGAWAITIGSPLGMQNSIALGLVAGKDRWISRRGGAQSLLQVSGGIVPGTSGAPVLDARGQAIGIVTAGLPTVEVFSDVVPQQKGQVVTQARNQAWVNVINANPNFDNPGINGAPSAVTGSGFAVPINIAKRVIEDLKAGRPVRPAYLGVQTQPVVGTQNLNPQQAAVQQADADGVLLTDVTAGGPAAKAGLLKGDVMLQFAGRPLGAPADLYRALLERRPGEKVPVVISRAGQKDTLMVLLGDEPGKK